MCPTCFWHRCKIRSATAASCGGLCFSLPCCQPLQAFVHQPMLFWALRPDAVVVEKDGVQDVVRLRFLKSSADPTPDHQETAKRRPRAPLVLHFWRGLT
eukprot:scaffold149_cov315-Pinguiococcus_pyrenoidosus.AAC.86